jgi:hypothetical protein
MRKMAISAVAELTAFGVCATWMSEETVSLRDSHRQEVGMMGETDFWQNKLRCQYYRIQLHYGR